MEKRTDRERSERGKPASFDRRTGAVHGSGSGAGGEGHPDEDYDQDSTAGSGAEPDGAQPVKPRDRLEGKPV